MGLKNMPDFMELCFINKDHAQYDLLFKSSQISKVGLKIFRLQILLIITQLQIVNPENIKSGLCFSSFMHHRNKI